MQIQILIVSPLTLIAYLRRLRSQMSAAIEPTTPIAASPEKASISGTAHQDSVGGYRCSNKHSKADPNSPCKPPYAIAKRITPTEELAFAMLQLL